MRPHPIMSTDPNDPPRQIGPTYPSPFKKEEEVDNRSTGIYTGILIITWIVGGLYFGLVALRPEAWMVSVYRAGLLIAGVAAVALIIIVLMRLQWKYRAAAVAASALVLVFGLLSPRSVLTALVVSSFTFLPLIDVIAPAYLVITLGMIMAVVISRTRSFFKVRTLASTALAILVLNIGGLLVGSLYGAPVARKTVNLGEKIYVVNLHEGFLGDPYFTRLFECNSAGLLCQFVQADTVGYREPQLDVRVSADGTALEAFIGGELVYSYQPEPASPP